MTGQTVTGGVEAEEEEGGEEEAVVTEIETGIGGGQGVVAGLTGETETGLAAGGGGRRVMRGGGERGVTPERNTARDVATALRDLMSRGIERKTSRDSHFIVRVTTCVHSET